MNYSGTFDLKQTWNPKGYGVTTDFVISRIKEIFGVLAAKKVRCRENADGSLTELYQWRIWHLPFLSISRKIQTIIDYYSLEGERHISYSSSMSVERFKTGGHFYVQIVAGAGAKNEEILEQACSIWRICGWQHITTNVSCGWISARASRNRG